MVTDPVAPVRINPFTELGGSARLISRTLSHYGITETLGRGRMGEVYRPEDTNPSLQAAIKILHGELTLALYRWNVLSGRR